MAGEPNSFRLLPTVLIVTALISGSLEAQQPGGGMGGPGGGMGGGMGGGRRGMGMREGRPNFDPVVVDGPPSPENVDSIMTLDAGQKDRYSTLYQNLMASTKTERDQVRQGREQFRNGGGDSDPSARQARRDEMREAMETLAKKQKTFDDTLKEFLSKDQLKHYDKWRDARRKEFEQRFQDRRGGGPGGPPPGQ